jgi:serine/threonine protein phosphatase 1
MATIAVGDIHGNLLALNDVLSQLRPELRTGDTVVFLGDYIDRGPDSKGCVDAILTFRHDVDAEVVALTGNHEDWFLKTLHDHRRHSWLLGMEAFDTIRSYSADAERIVRDAMKRAGAALYLEQVALPYEAFFDCMPAEHLEFFETLRLYHQTADCACAHGGLDSLAKDIQQQSRHDLIWGGVTFPDGYEGSEVVVYGHHNNAVLDDDGWPKPAIVGRTIGVDTISHGVLTAIRLPDNRLFQSARYGERVAEL